MIPWTWKIHSINYFYFLVKNKSEAAASHLALSFFPCLHEMRVRVAPGGSTSLWRWPFVISFRTDDIYSGSIIKKWTWRLMVKRRTDTPQKRTRRSRSDAGWTAVGDKTCRAAGMKETRYFPGASRALLEPNIMGKEAMRGGGVSTEEWGMQVHTCAALLSPNCQCKQVENKFTPPPKKRQKIDGRTGEKDWEEVKKETCRWMM